MKLSRLFKTVKPDHYSGFHSGFGSYSFCTAGTDNAGIAGYVKNDIQSDLPADEAICLSFKGTKQTTAEER